AQQIDLLPTLCEMMGWETPKTAQGRSLWPAIQGKPMEDVPLFAESVEGGYQSKPEMQSTFVRSVRTREWKLIARMSPDRQENELYDLVRDPGEKNNVVEQNPEEYGQLMAQLVSWMGENKLAREEIEAYEAEHQLVDAAEDPANLEVPTILEPHDGETLYFESESGAIHAKWTGNPHAAYVIQYDVGEGWHRLTGEYSVPRGIEQIFGPLPADGWKPLYQWNPYRLRIRPRGLPDGWSDWITIGVAPLSAKRTEFVLAPERPC
ncbi:MAG: sulfatase/phosphatase domain-containing protein, partial [Candidatus Hydrogenedentota bacterium]